MANNFPSIGEYNQLIQKKGGSAFNSLIGINLIPSRTTPIKVFLFGSGAFAAVFKGSLNGENYAIRCFLSAEDETISRYKVICDYLRSINAKWITGCEFIDNEISLNGKSFPILKMEWISGLLINQFVSNHLSDNNVLTALQQQLIEISNDLELNKIGHGDLQCGNIIVTGTASNFQVRLIDYDGMYVPTLAYKKSIEKGRSEFQHPKRTLNNFSSEMDRFSFWVILTALEALKYDKSLWIEVMQGGFNTLDNFLFTVQDFLNPNQSKLFNRLYKINSSTLNFYLDKLKMFCNNDVSKISIPILFNEYQLKDREKGLNNLVVKTTIIEKKNENSGSFKIISENEQLVVLSSSFEKIGTTPLELDKIIYTGKRIIISNGKEIKHVDLDKNKNEINISFKDLREELKTNGFKIEVNEEEKRKKIEEEEEEQREKLRKEQEEKERIAYYEKEREIRLKKQKEDNEIREKFEKEQKEKLRIKEVEDRKKRKKRTFYTILIIVICSIVVIGFGVRNYYSNFNTNNTEKVIDNNDQIINDLPRTEEIVIPEETITDKIFYDINWEVTDESNAEYFRIITLDDMGKPLGKVRDYFISGELQWEGQLTYVDKYDNKNDIMEGKCVWYYENGNKMAESIYKDGELNGDFTDYYENGGVKAKGVYLNGELWGQYRSFSEDGNEIVENNVFTEKENSSDFNTNKTFSTTLKIEGKLRDEPGPTSSVISYIPEGASIKVLAYHEGYYKVSYNYQEGFINEMYLVETHNMLTMK